LQFGILAKHEGHDNNIFFREGRNIGYSVALVKTLKAMEFGFFQRTELFFYLALDSSKVFLAQSFVKVSAVGARAA